MEKYFNIRISELEMEELEGFPDQYKSYFYVAQESESIFEPKVGYEPEKGDVGILDGEIFELSSKLARDEPISWKDKNLPRRHCVPFWESASKKLWAPKFFIEDLGGKIIMRDNKHFFYPEIKNN